MMNNQKRDLTIDLAKGIAILFVYFGHSIIYHPIDLRDYYHWCFVLERMVTSFNMPMFFIISGLLFGFSHKTNRQVLADKTRRLLIPYLFTMSIITVSKFFLPSEMARHKLTGMGGHFFGTYSYMVVTVGLFMSCFGFLFWLYLLEILSKRTISG